MELQVLCKALVFVFVLSSIDHASAKSAGVKNFVSMTRVLDHGIFAELTNSSCTEEGPLTDVDDITRFYQCILISEGTTTYYFIVHWQCAPGGQYDPESGACVEVLIEFEVSDTTTELTTPEPTTMEPTTVESTTEPPTSGPTDSTTQPPELTTPEPTTIESITSGSTDSSSEPPTSGPTEPPTSGPTEPPTSGPTEPPTSGSTDFTTDITTSTDSTTDSTTDQPTTSELSTVVTTIEPTTSAAPSRCTEDGIFPDPDPTKYYRCITIFGKFYFYVFTCPATACFNPTSKLCVLGTCAAVTTPTTEAPETPPPVVCTGAGIFPYPSDCYKYYHCIQIGPTWYTYILSCPPGAYFDTTTSKCLIGVCPAQPAPTTLPTPALTTLVSSNPATTTTLAPVPTNPPQPFTCVKDGTYQHPDCAKYYRCQTISGTIYTYIMTCPPGNFYNPVDKLCTTDGSACPSVTQIPTTMVTSVVTSIMPTTPTTPTTIPPGLPTCETAGVRPYPTDCTKYFRCLQVTGTWYVYIFTCPMGSYFNSNVPGCIIGVCPETTTPISDVTTDVTTDIISSTTDGITTDSSDTPDPTASTITETGSTDISTTGESMPTTVESTATTVENTATTVENTATTVENTATTEENTATTGESTATEVSTTSEAATTEIPSTTEFETTIDTTQTELSTTPVSTVTEEATVVLEADPTAEMPDTTTTPAPFVCTSEGSFPNPDNCQKYFNCISISGTLYKYSSTCPANTHYDATKKLCTAGNC